MSVNFRVDGLMIAVGVGVPVLAFLGYKVATGAKDIAAAAVDKVNPVSPNNIVNQSVESIGQAITGDSSWTPGGWAFDWTHNVDGTYRPQAGLDVVGLIPGAGSGLKFIADTAVKAAPYVNPANPNNVINKAVENTFGQENVSGVADRVFSVVDLLNPWNESDAYAKIIWGID